MRIILKALHFGSLAFIGFMVYLIGSAFLFGIDSDEDTKIFIIETAAAAGVMIALVVAIADTFIPLPEDTE